MGFKHAFKVQTLYCSVRFIISCTVLAFSAILHIDKKSLFFFLRNKKKSLTGAVKLTGEISQWNLKCGIVVEDLPPQNRLIEFCWMCLPCSVKIKCIQRVLRVLQTIFRNLEKFDFFLFIFLKMRKKLPYTKFQMFGAF